MAKNLLPDNVKRLRGTYRKYREKRSSPLEPGIPRRPEFLTRGAEKYYKLIASRLHSIGTITQVDDLTLGLMAESFSTFVKASHYLEENGQTYEFVNAKGELSIRARPEVKIANEAWTQVVTLFKQYGLTALSRNNVSITVPPSKPSKPFNWSD